ncbi:hypothetical protein [Bacterioplanoides sp. SCSIO 12839]|uniref:hypothetical protein n=1 Tax=Bacterioplanoides sp. SCSIO 12839 TaxID=2829569 RepID=UPI002102CEC6|nr:hypothetical protein [Bacterioplanoides sp. SCSIO 12839]UTW48705.1 glycosyltransferase [Bacterioplanoides sp. SCSIO 12839]
MLKIFTHHPSRDDSKLQGIVQFSRLSGLKSGLEKLGVPFLYQPPLDFMPEGNVLVISDHMVLREIYKRKKQNNTFNLLAGPILEIEDTHSMGAKDLITGPDIENPLSTLDKLDTLFSRKEVDGVLTAGSWAREGWRFAAPEIGMKTFEWFAGVDTDFWDGKTAPKPKRALLYAKTNPGIVKNAHQALRSLGIDVTLVEYGHYNKETYKKVLASVDFAVFVSEKETQGIALAEAWAMNVPTFCWDPFHSFMNGAALLPTSSCPYITKQTGNRWRNIEDLKNLLYIYKRDYYSPRSWVLENMSDTVSAQRLLDIFNIVNAKKSGLIKNYVR